MTKKWNAERKKEHYYQMAKKQRYRSRASYKLLQLNKKFKIIRKGSYVVDLGAAPGGWSQVALESVGEDGMVIGVDLNRIKPFEEDNFLEIRGDFTTDETIERIEKVLGKKADVILSDASPQLTGIKDMDHLRSIDLASGVLEIAASILKPGGKVIIKVFPGEEFEDFLQKTKKLFNTVKTTKPPSSRKGSKEMYLIARGFKGSKHFH
jgi:23S rRNA (uridine2552-2'-O)-methyltransferase